MGVVGVGVELHADETCEACDRGAESANVHTQQQGVGLIGKSGEQQCGGNVADDLAGEQRDQILFPGQKGTEQMIHRRDPREVAGEDEKGHKSQKEHEVCLYENLSIINKQYNNYYTEHEIPGHYPQYNKKANSQ